jgi:hemoglobin
MTEATATQICELAIHNLVTAFYTRVRRDHLLAPVFARLVGASDTQWAAYIALLDDFWSSMFLPGARNRPRPADARLPDLDPALFERWLALLSGTCADLFEPNIAAEFQTHMTRIAAVLWPIGVGNKNSLEARAPH